MSRLAEALLSWPARRPWRVLAAAFVIAALAAVSASRSEPSSSLAVMLGDDGRAAAALAAVVERFGAVDELLVLASVLEEADRVRDAPAGEPPVARLRRFARDLESALGAGPAAVMADRVQYAADDEVLEFYAREVVPHGLYYLDDDEFGEVARRLTLDGMREQFRRNEAMIAAPGAAAGAMAETLMRDPLRLREFLTERLGAARAGFRTFDGGPEFISEDGRHLLVRIGGVRAATDLDFAKALTDAVGDAVAAVDTAGLSVEVGGAYAIAAASERAIRRDMTLSIAGSIVLLQIVFLAGYRSLLAFPLAFMPLGLGILAAFGVHALAWPAITPLTAVIGAVLAGLGVDYCIHYVSHYESACAGDRALRGLAAEHPVRAHRARLSRAAAETSRAVGPALVFACATSVVGFLAVLGSGVRALSDFAAVGAMGLVAILVAALTVLPAAMVVAGRFGAGRGPRFRLDGLVEWIERRRSRVTAGALVVLAGALVIVMVRPGAAVAFEPDLGAMHPRPNPALEAQHRVGEVFGSGAESLIVHVAADSPEDLVRRAAAVDRALRAPAARSAGVAGAWGLGSVLIDPRAIEGRAARIARLDRDRLLREFDAALEESIFEPAGFGEYRRFLETLTSGGRPPGLEAVGRHAGLARAMLPRAVGAGSAREAVTMVSIAAPMGTRDERDAVIAGVEGLIADVPGATLTGVTVVAREVERAVRDELPRAVSIAAAVVVGMLILVLRRARDVALVLVPPVFGIGCLLAYMSLTGERFNLANVIAMPLLVGIGVDNGIFVVSAARRARVHGDAARDCPSPLPSPRGAGERTRIAATAHAMVMANLTTTLAFGGLMWTSTPAIQSLGRVVAVGVLATLVGTIFLLVPLVGLFSKRAAGSPIPGDGP